MKKLNAMSGAAIALSALASQCPAAGRRPNLLIILADQWRGSALQCLGQEPVKTPCLDSLSKEGVLFADAVSCYPVSSPARAMIMTGMYPPGNKVIGNCNSLTAPFGAQLQQDAVCWSDALSEKGYQTCYIGKWHLDSPRRPYVDTYNNKGKIAWNEWCPPRRRHHFDYWVAYGTYDRHLHPMYWSADAPRDGFYYVDEWGPRYEADVAVRYLEQHARKGFPPFAMVVSMNPPHTGYGLVPEKYKALYANLNADSLCAALPDLPPEGTASRAYYKKSIADYYACMTGVDENIGRIIRKLKELKVFDNTIVVFTSDHGVCMGRRGIKGKDVFYEEAMRIPMIVVWKNRVKPRIDRRTMIANGDLFPTLLHLMGFGRAVPRSVQTKDFSKVLLSGKADAKAEQPYFKIFPDSLSGGWRGWRTHRYTFALHAGAQGAGDVLLFDRQTDPFELRNVAAEHPEVTRFLRARLFKFLKRIKDPFRFIIKASAFPAHR